MNDLISIIVPIYNVEEYLDKCIESIIAQSYSKLEIILIDDGSTDKSGIIAEKYSLFDHRIVVIHKKNGGLSDARNVGIDIAKGKYLMFVDSDDYISIDCVEYLYTSLTRTQSSISVGKLKKTKNRDELYTGIETEKMIFDKYEAINQLFYANKYSVAAPGKLYLAELFDGIRFPIGKLHEDVFTTYKVFLKSDRIYYGNKIVYFYYHRPGSIMVSHFSTKRLHIIDALNQIENDIPLEEYGCIKGFASQNVEDMFMLLALKPGKEIITKYGIWKRIKKYRLTVLFDHNSSKRVRGYALLSYLGRNVSTLIYNKYQDIKWNCNHEV